MLTKKRHYYTCSYFPGTVFEATGKIHNSAHLFIIVDPGKLGINPGDPYYFWVQDFPKLKEHFAYKTPLWQLLNT